jgi:AcrR family transcriptional regulator
MPQKPTESATPDPRGENSGPAPRKPLRADAARNVAQIRAAALAAFHGRGLDTPLEEIAATAKVSKGTIYTHFGGRHGLIDAVIEELVAAAMHATIDRARSIEDPWERIATYINDRRDLQYREPAFTDALLMTYPESRALATLAGAATDATIELIQQGHRARVLRPDFTAEDLYWADIANGLALRHRPKPSPQDYDRRTRQFLDSLRPR